jgi:nickel/cobalt exporter
MRGAKIARALFLAILLLSWLVNPPASHAHPMGNFSISHYAGIRVEPGFVELRYLIDMAEIPTYQEIQDTGIIAKEGDPGLAAYLEKKAELLAGGLALQVNGQPLLLQLISQSVIFPAGAGGLPTMKLGFIYRAALENLPPRSAYAVHYRDANFAGHAGWKEIVVTAEPGFELTASSAQAADRSAQLSNYPTDLLSSPPQDLEASFSFFRSFSTESNTTPVDAVHLMPMRPTVSAHGSAFDEQLPSSKVSRAHVSTAGRPATAAAIEPSAMQSPNTIGVPSAPAWLHGNRQATPRNKFTELVSARNLSLWFLFTAALIAAGLGALHALEPGHGKTIVAAYLVGSRGTARHAVFLGSIVTIAHTAGVYLLGAITLYASKYIVPEQLYPWLGMISGIIIAVLASYLLIRAWTGEDGDHSHAIGRVHSHWFASLGRRGTAEKGESLGDGGALSGGAAKTVSLTQLLTLGITGGIVPCPAALVVLLGAFSLHRVGFGMFLIVAFSLGLAGVLIAIGLLMVYARQFLARWKSNGSMIKRWLPVASAGFMLMLGLGIAGRAVLIAGVGSGFLAQAKLPSFVGIVLLGLFLGMRHSTDPDHVVAVSTIASRERSVGQGALIGMLWGVGHTLTIFLVGSAIILFGLVIPPRVGLSMEFSVALMLIVLGVLNLAGAPRWLTERFAPVNSSKTRENSGTAGNTAESSLGRLMNRYGSYQVIRPLVIGLVHGLAGSAAVALLVLSTIRSPLWAIAYLLVFGIGTIVGMMLMTSAMAIPVACTSKHFEVTGRYLSSISGIASTGFGLFLVYQIGVVDGLFRANVYWKPQ